MVKIRLARQGKLNFPSYRIVVADNRSPRDGKFIEKIGYYNPLQNEENIDLARVEFWKGNGAQISDTVADIVRRKQTGEKPQGRKNIPLKTEAKAE